MASGRAVHLNHRSALGLGNRLLLIGTVPLAFAVEAAFLYTCVNEAARRISADEGEVLMWIKA